MTKKSKIQTPDWILKGEKPKAEKKKEKTFTIRRCPKCKSEYWQTPRKSVVPKPSKEEN